MLDRRLTHHINPILIWIIIIILLLVVVLHLNQSIYCCYVVYKWNTCTLSNYYVPFLVLWLYYTPLETRTFGNISQRCKTSQWKETAISPVWNEKWKPWSSHDISPQTLWYDRQSSFGVRVNRYINRLVKCPIITLKRTLFTIHIQLSICLTVVMLCWSVCSPARQLFGIRVVRIQSTV